MKEFLTKVFQDSQGNPSSIRVVTVIGWIVAVILSFIPGTNVELVIIWLIASTMPKIFQKYIEERYGNKKDGE